MKKDNKKEEAESPEMTAALIFHLLEKYKFFDHVVTYHSIKHHSLIGLEFDPLQQQMAMFASKRF